MNLTQVPVLTLLFFACGVQAEEASREAGSQESGSAGQSSTVDARADWPAKDADLVTYLAGLPFADQLPSFPEYEIPIEADCEWIIEEGRAVSTRGLATLTGEYLVGQAYRASVAAGHELPVDVGVRDDAGSVVFAHGWNQYGNRSVFIKTGPETYAGLRCRIVGLDDECEVQVSWGARWGFVEELGLYNIGLRGPSDSFIIRSQDTIGDLTIDGCWWLQRREAPTDGSVAHASGMHIGGWRRLIWRRHRWRGEKPDQPGVNLREHSAYLKSSRGETWIVENDLRGGNRTGFQIRPEPGHNEQPVGPVVIARNFADGHGWNHGDSRRSFDGGCVISVWSNPAGKTFVVGNRITDAKYGCLLLGGQPRGKNWFNERGFPIGETWIWHNVFENSHGGRQAGLPRRAAVDITGPERVHFGPTELPEGAQVIVDSAWGIERHGVHTGEIRVYDAGLTRANIWKYDGGKNRRMSDAEKRALLVE